MKKEIKKQWIENLTNGKYEQGLDKLRTPDDKYCCLGVLCDMYVKENTSELHWSNDVYSEVYVYNGVLLSGAIEGNNPPYVYEEYYAPEPVLDWAGIAYPKGNATNGEYQQEFDKSPSGIVAKMNDDGKSFKQIAKWIEKNL